jgi:hypothetical protein
MPSALRDVRSALYNLYSEALTGPVVFNGPRPRSTTPKEYLLIGVNGLEELEAGMRSSQGASDMGGGDWREEAGEIDCTAVAWTGDTNMAAIRSAVESIVDVCETALRADRHLGGLLTPAHHIAEQTRLDVREQHTDKGPFVEAVFTVAYTTTLTS